MSKVSWGANLFIYLIEGSGEGGPPSSLRPAPISLSTSLVVPCRT